MFKKIETPTACEMRSVIHFLNVKNMKLAEIHCQLCDVYGEHAISSSMVRRWVRLFNEGCENVHDDPWSGRPSVVNEDLVRAVEEKIRENRWFTITSLSLHFPQISRSLLHEIVSGDLENKRRGMLSRGVVMIRDNTRPHTATATQNLITTFGWEQFDHPP